MRTNPTSHSHQNPEVSSLGALEPSRLAAETGRAQELASDVSPEWAPKSNFGLMPFVSNVGAGSGTSSSIANLKKSRNDSPAEMKSIRRGGGGQNAELLKLNTESCVADNSAVTSQEHQISDKAHSSGHSDELDSNSCVKGSSSSRKFDDQSGVAESSSSKSRPAGGDFDKVLSSSTSDPDNPINPSSFAEVVKTAHENSASIVDSQQRLQAISQVVALSKQASQLVG